MKAIRVSYEDVREPGVFYPERRWKCEVQIHDHIEYRPLTLGTMLDMASYMKPDEWAALQHAIQLHGSWITL